MNHNVPALKYYNPLPKDTQLYTQSPSHAVYSAKHLLIQWSYVCFWLPHWHSTTFDLVIILITT